MTDNPCFESAPTWKAARALLSFPPIEPRFTFGYDLRSIRIHVRDHKLRELSVEDRTLEAHYGGFVFTQSRKGIGEARRWALEVRYGPSGREARVAGFPARTYELGPEPPPDDIDPREPAVITWHDADMFYLIASDQMTSEKLLRIAESLYKGRRRRPRHEKRSPT